MSHPRKTPSNQPGLAAPQPPTPEERSSSAERKRRHTGSNEPGRRPCPYPYATSATSGSSSRTIRPAAMSAASAPNQPGRSLETAIDLTTPPRQRTAVPPRLSSVDDTGASGLSLRRGSDIVLPKWQPDSEVTRCPVCQTEFSFWYRKHHCRKCGRVPPNPYEEAGLSSPAASEPDSPFSRALGGGEVVRVCNPCVPDPWTPDAAPTRSAGPSTQMPVPPPPPPPRRQIREEDECPVCGNEMPPGEQVREKHIQECIATRFSSTPSTSTAAHPPPIPQTSTGAEAAASTSAPSDAASSRPRSTSYRPRGMFVYRAGEKDCIDDSGQQTECVICFEEFQPGDELGRMECLCKFHRACLRQWWDTKGVGNCPTHTLPTE
ncbi:hypothetical protein BAUCODRAFT_119431 [Baudoinia panamericana UAMH 10762]|uniref:RING-type E3 ubiquitin transferase n=1 Tax=Baudoinia panamericana (strain UAMH 10762) TaxID=717646 RepID=M2NL37_BAUPA|nr:uncharacterized protein BAUCODRAFT_119431 [Baudoinia panamericana UAMH 10762]EMC99865.1 hypothetical protein BAUCODRAFT_119431 [Baudoinia panamericana UAMH 10762]